MKLTNKDYKKVEKDVLDQVQAGKPRATAIAIALDNAGISKDFNKENTMRRIEDSSRGGYLKDKGPYKGRFRS